MGRHQRRGDAAVQQDIGRVGLAVQQGGDREIDFGDAVARACDAVEGHRFASPQPFAKRVDAGVRIGSEGAIQQGQGIGVSFKLAEDLDMGHDTAAVQVQRPLCLPRQDQVRPLEIPRQRQGQRLVIKPKASIPRVWAMVSKSASASDIRPSPISAQAVTSTSNSGPISRPASNSPTRAA